MLDVDISVMGGIGVVDYIRRVLKSNIPIIIAKRGTCDVEDTSLDKEWIESVLDVGATTILDGMHFERALKVCNVLNDAPKLTHFADVVLAQMKERKGNSGDPRRSFHKLPKRKTEDSIPVVCYT